MANVRLIAPFAAAAGAREISIDGQTIGELCRTLAERYGGSFLRLLDREGKLSKDVVVLVNRQNAHTLSGAQTRLGSDTEVLIMPLMSGG
ncbi:MAG: MoaD/ThiS family protein [Spirochaetia bacterium]|jgi:molybdopterin converting factor small subunit